MSWEPSWFSKQKSSLLAYVYLQFFTCCSYVIQVSGSSFSDFYKDWINFERVVYNQIYLIQMFSAAALLRDSWSLRYNNYMMYFQPQDRAVEKGTGCTETSFLTIPLALLKRGKMQTKWWRVKTRTAQLSGQECQHPPLGSRYVALSLECHSCSAFPRGTSGAEHQRHSLALESHSQPKGHPCELWLSSLSVPML